MIMTFQPEIVRGKLRGYYQYTNFQKQRLENFRNITVRTTNKKCRENFSFASKVL